LPTTLTHSDEVQVFYRTVELLGGIKNRQKSTGIPSTLCLIVGIGAFKLNKILTVTSWQRLRCSIWKLSLIYDHRERNACLAWILCWTTW